MGEEKGTYIKIRPFGVCFCVSVFGELRDKKSGFLGPIFGDCYCLLFKDIDDDEVDDCKGENTDD